MLLHYYTMCVQTERKAASPSPSSAQPVDRLCLSFPTSKPLGLRAATAREGSPIADFYLPPRFVQTGADLQWTPWHSALSRMTEMDRQVYLGAS